MSRKSRRRGSLQRVAGPLPSKQHRPELDLKIIGSWKHTANAAILTMVSRRSERPQSRKVPVFVAAAGLLLVVRDPEIVGAVIKSIVP